MNNEKRPFGILKITSDTTYRSVLKYSIDIYSNIKPLGSFYIKENQCFKSNDVFYNNKMQLGYLPYLQANPVKRPST